ncbi:MAG: pectin acetylesterase-family hydrolase [Rubrivivax sp.]
MHSVPKKFLAVLALLAAPVFAQQSPWQTVANPPPVATGADGLPHSASCSGYPGTDASYRFWVKPGDPKKLAVVFDGGGACWDNLTCSFPFGGGVRDPLLQFYTPAIPAGVDPSQYGGLLDFSNTTNPVRDWTVVALPYCTGDVHLGSVDRQYQMVGHPGLPRTFTIHHRGYDNFMVVLDWMQKNLQADVSDLLVTGASAGGYGAAAHAPWVARQYPRARLAVLADASQGVATAGFESGTPGRGSWNMQLAPWVHGDNPMAVPSNELVRRGAQAYPNGRFAQYTTNQDGVQIGFYAYMKLFFGPGGACRRIAPDWNQQMLAALSVDKAALPNFRSYLRAGDGHTVIGDSGFYAAQAGAPTVAAWLTAMLDPAGVDAWQHVACPECLTPLPCSGP